MQGILKQEYHQEDRKTQVPEKKKTSWKLVVSSIDQLKSTEN
jgi:hypothetical protein